MTFLPEHVGLRQCDLLFIIYTYTHIYIYIDQPTPNYIPLLVLYDYKRLHIFFYVPE